MNIKGSFESPSRLSQLESMKMQQSIELGKKRDKINNLLKNKDKKRKYLPFDTNEDNKFKIHELKQKQARLVKQRGELRKFGMNQKVKFEMLKHKIFNQIGNKRVKVKHSGRRQIEQHHSVHMKRSMSRKLARKKSHNLPNRTFDYNEPHHDLDLKIGTGLAEFSDENLIKLPHASLTRDISKDSFKKMKQKPDVINRHDTLHDEDNESEQDKIFQNIRLMPHNHSQVALETAKKHPRQSGNNISNSRSNSRQNGPQNSSKKVDHSLLQNPSHKSQLKNQLNGIYKGGLSNHQSYEVKPRLYKAQKNTRSRQSNIRSSRKPSFRERRRQYRSSRDQQEDEGRLPQLPFKMRPTSKQMAVLAMKKMKKVNMKELSFQRDAKRSRDRVHIGRSHTQEPLQNSQKQVKAVFPEK